MKFWDTSAVAPLIVEEARSTGCRSILKGDRDVAVWALTRVELHSALRRKQREGALDALGVRKAFSRVERLAEHWTEVDALAQVREQAERLLALHPLRAADALQLAAALVLASGRPQRRGFVCVDVDLAAAAEQQGFEVLVPSRS